MLILVPVYWQAYGWQNFLWFSDIGLFLTFFAVWLSSSFLLSMTLIAFPLELLWNIDFFVQLVTGHTVVGLAAYMFDNRLPLFLRSLSLFHVMMPIVWIWYFLQWGYDRRAFKYVLVLFWVITMVTYTITHPQDNINWVFLPTIRQWNIAPSSWLLCYMIGLPLLLFWPMHRLLLYIRKCRTQLML